MSSYFRCILVVGSILLCSCLVWAGEEKFPLWVEVKRDGINLRADSTVSSPVVAKLSSGQRLEAIAKLYEWYKVKLPKGIKVYIYRKYVDLTSDGAKVTGTRVNVRSGPGLNYPVLGQVNEGQLLEPCSSAEQSEKWFCAYSDTAPLYAWVHSRFVKVIGERKLAKATKPKEEPVKKTQVKSGPGSKKEAHKEIKILSDSKKKSELPIAIGRLQEVGRIIGRKYEYKLVNEKGKIRYYLSGDSHTFSPFSGQRVKIYGEIVRVASDNIPVIEVHKIERER